MPVDGSSPDSPLLSLSLANLPRLSVGHLPIKRADPGNIRASETRIGAGARWAGVRSVNLDSSVSGCQNRSNEELLRVVGETGGSPDG